MKVARGFVGCVRATGGEVGAGIWGVRSPEGGGAGRPGGVAHGGATAAVWVKVTDARGERGRERGARTGEGRNKEEEKKKKRKKRKEKERKKNGGKRNEVQSS